MKTQIKLNSITDLLGWHDDRENVNHCFILCLNKSNHQNGASELMKGYLVCHSCLQLECKTKWTVISLDIPRQKKKTFKKSYPIVSIQFGNPQFISVINKVNDFKPFFSFFGQHFKVEKVMATFVTPYSLGISNHVCREPQISEYERALPKCMHCFVVVDISGFLGKVCKVI